MEQNYDNYIFDETLGRHPYSFSLGFKEVLFLGLIFFFGFCGFSLCVETIYSGNAAGEIDDVTIHKVDISGADPISHVIFPVKMEGDLTTN